MVAPAEHGDRFPVELELRGHDAIVAQAVRAEWGHPVVVSTHPRTRQRLEALGDADAAAVLGDPGVRFEKPFGFLEWVRLQMDAACVLSDSGTLTEESSLLGFPAVMLREAHERPEGMDAGTVIMSGLEPGRVIEAVRVQMALRQDRQARDRVADYQDLHVSKKVVQIIHSYVDYVNRTVWRKG